MSELKIPDLNNLTSIQAYQKKGVYVYYYHGIIVENACMSWLDYSTTIK